MEHRSSKWALIANCSLFEASFLASEDLGERGQESWWCWCCRRLIGTCCSHRQTHLANDKSWLPLPGKLTGASDADGEQSAREIKSHTVSLTWNARGWTDSIFNRLNDRVLMHNSGSSTGSSLKSRVSSIWWQRVHRAVISGQRLAEDEVLSRYNDQTRLLPAKETLIQDMSFVQIMIIHSSVMAKAELLSNDTWA